MSLRQPRRAPHRLNRVDQATARARVPAAPPADTQRLLNGKTLADNRLGAPVRVCLPGGTIPSAVLSPSSSPKAPPGDLPSSSGSSLPSTRSRQNSTTRDVTLTLDNATTTLAEQELSTYRAGIANPRFCSRIWVPPSPRGRAARVRGVPVKGTLTARARPAHPQRGPQPSPSVEAPPGDLPSSSGSSSPSTRSRQNSTTRDITLILDNATPVLAEQEHSTYHAGIANPSSGRACSRIWGAQLFFQVGASSREGGLNLN
ncbi:hypothetical protein C8J57DRAFT_1725802 [Mycena rebaudengoi]|nr:hypothetical protein C8J57DRAFT_1725802 [Mycena rebaudengoi]